MLIKKVGEKLEAGCSEKRDKKVEARCSNEGFKTNLKGKSLNKSYGKILTIKRKRVHSIKNTSKKQVLASSKGKILSREEKIFMLLFSDENKGYCLFLINVLPTFDDINKTLQSEAPYIHKLRGMYPDLLKDLNCRFLKPSAVKK